MTLNDQLIAMFGERTAPGGTLARHNFAKWFGDSKVTDANGKPLVVYHATRSDISAFRPGSFFTEAKDLAERFYDGKRRSFTFGARTLYATYLSIKNPLDVRNLGLSHMIGIDELAEMLGVTGETWRQMVKEAGQPALEKTRNDSKSTVAWNMDEMGLIMASADHRTRVDDLLPVRYKSHLWDVLERKPVQEVLAKLGYDGVRMHEMLSAMSAPLKGMRKQDAPINWKENVDADTWLAFRPEQVKSAIGNSGAFSITDPNISDRRALLLANVLRAEEEVGSAESAGRRLRAASSL